MDLVGQMRQRIQIATRETTRDELFGVENGWVLCDPIFAKVDYKTIGTDEINTANQNSPDAKVNFIIRFREVGYEDEIIWKGNRYQIEGVVPDTHEMYLTIETKFTGKQYANA